MALESFYGGKQGISPVIKASFWFIDKNDPAYQAKISKWSAYEGNLKNYFETLVQTKNIFGITSKDITSATSSNKLKWTEKLLQPFTMEECLSRIDYKDVWYGELCIIDAENHLNPNHGKLFRRTLRKWENSARNTEDTLHAEYIGTLTGPAGGIPNIKFGSINEMRKEAAGLAPTLDTDNVTVPMDVSHWQYAYPDNRGRSNSSTVTYANIRDDETPAIATDDYNNISVLGSNKAEHNITLVPGQREVDSNNSSEGYFPNSTASKNNKSYEYYDEIKYTWCNVRRTLTDNTVDDSWIYLGFQIPYPSFEVDRVEELYTYNNNVLIYDQQGRDNKKHPFYHHLTFHIPRGTRGIGPEELFIVGKDGHNKPDKPLYDFNSIYYDQSTDTYQLIDDPQIVTPSIDTYWVAKWVLYNPKTEVDEDRDIIYQYLGSYRDIDSVELNTSDDDPEKSGTVTVNYSDGSSVQFDRALTWIKRVNIVASNDQITARDYGHFIIEFNNNKLTDIDVVLPLIKAITYTDSTGQITFNHANGLEITTGDIIYTKSWSVDDRGKFTGVKKHYSYWRISIFTLAFCFTLWW